MTNYEILEEYLAFLKSTGYAESTIKTYYNHIRHFYSWAEWIDINIANINTRQMIGYKTQIKKIYSTSTINNKLSAIRNLYDYLIQVEEKTTNPVINALFIPQDKTRPQFLTLTQRELLLNFLSSKGNHIELAFNIMMYAGLRVSEVCELKIRDIELREDKMYLHVNDRKTNKLRLCPVFDEKTKESVLDQLNNKLLGDRLIDISKRTLQHYAKEFQTKYNIKFSVHTCRHIYATDRIREGIRIELLKTLMGHKSITTTLLYIYIAEDEIYSLLN